jgi:hypothetical protein
LRTASARVDPGLFPPELVVYVKAVACEIPSTTGVPLSSWSIPELGRYVRERVGIEATMSDVTIWRWLTEDAIKPWQHRTWIFPRDPNFVEKASRILDLYHRTWKGRRLQDDEFVISADEKTSIQARKPRHPSLPPAPGIPARVEHEYKRLGAWVYTAAMDVHHAKFFGRCDRKNGIASFDRLVAQFMTQQPYRSARRVFLIVDNGSAHRGERAAERLRARYPNLVLVHGPIHGSWLNQVEIYFSIVQRKALTPSDFSSMEDLADRLLRFQKHYEAIAKPFEWRFTKRDLLRLVERLDQQQHSLQAA